MAIEALLTIDQTFVHKLQHDLESILYVILYICTVVHSPGLQLHKLDVTHHLSPPITTWFCNNSIRELGYRKLAHLENYDVAILPYFTAYWHDFLPFVKDLIITCFPVEACFPNDFQYDQALRILKTAYNSVGEPASPGHTPTPKVFHARRLTQTRRQASDSLDRDSKKGRYL